jgi:hypothetical protein
MNSSDWRDWEINSWVFSNLWDYTVFGIVYYVNYNPFPSGFRTILNSERRPTYVNNAIVFREFKSEFEKDYPLL